MAEITVNAYTNSYTGKLQDSPVSVPANETGQIWTVTGSGFGTKSRQSPVIWEQFAGSTEGQLLNNFNPNWVAYNGDGAYITAADARYVGGRSAANNSHRIGANDFWTSYKSIAQTRKTYMSYYVLISPWVDGLDGAVRKLARTNAFATQGNRYGGNGTTHMGGGSAGGYVNHVGTDFNHSEEMEYPSAWFRIETELYIGDSDTNTGYYNATVGETQVLTVSNILSQSSAQQVRTDTILLGLELANCRTRYEISNLLPSTQYTITVNSVAYNYTSGSSPTKEEILEDLAAQIVAAHNSAAAWTIGDYITLHNGLTAVYGANFVKSTVQPLIQNADIYVDTDNTARFVIGNAATYAACTIREPQPYSSWSDTECKFTVFAPTISGTKYLYFVDDAGTATLRGVMNNNGTLS